MLMAAAVIPLALGFVWYHPKLLGSAWQRAAALSDETLASGRMAMIFGLTFALSFALSVGLYTITVHQGGFMSLMLNEPGFGTPGSPMQLYVDDFIARFGNKHRTFGHGALHGTLGALFFGMEGKQR
jgi:hypothetical protein